MEDPNRRVFHQGLVAGLLFHDGLLGPALLRLVPEHDDNPQGAVVGRHQDGRAAVGDGAGYPVAIDEQGVVGQRHHAGFHGRPIGDHSADMRQSGVDVLVERFGGEFARQWRQLGIDQRFALFFVFTCRF